MYDYIRKQGAQAARQGLTRWENPYLKAQAMPGHTGESPTRWQTKVDAWEAGWDMETVARQSVVSPPGNKRHA